MEPLKHILRKPSLFSMLFFGWLIPLVRHHRHFGTAIDQIPEIPPDFNFYEDYKVIVKNWEIECRRPNPSFFKAVWRSRRCEIIWCGVLMTWLFVSQPIQSLLLYYFVKYLRDDSASIAMGCAWGAAFLINQLLGMVIANQGTLRIVLFSSKLKSWSCMLIAEKLLKTSNTELNSKNEATKATNVIGNDIELFEFVILIGNLFAVPFATPLAVVILYVYVGVAGILGAALVASHIPLMIFLGKITSNIRMKLATVSDSRVKLISNLIEGIKVVKLYAWEQPLLEAIFKERASEIRQLLKMAWTQIGAKVLNMGMIATSSVITLLYFVHQGNELTSEVAFLTVSLLSAMNTLLNYFGSMGLRMLFLVLATFHRITEVLLLEEMKPLPQPTTSFRGVKVVRASFSWEK